jgi:hypothetical protein
MVHWCDDVKGGRFQVSSGSVSREEKRLKMRFPQGAWASCPLFQSPGRATRPAAPILSEDLPQSRKGRQGTRRGRGEEGKRVRGYLLRVIGEDEEAASSGRDLFCLRFAHAMQNPLRVAIKMPLARQRHSEKSVGERMVNGEASSRERGHLVRLSACGDSFGAARPHRPTG